MSSEHDGNVMEILERAAPSLDQGLKERTVSAMVRTNGRSKLLPNEAVPNRRRTRRIAFALGAAAVVLFALGFVPFQDDQIPSAWAQALEAARQAQSVHIEYRIRQGGRELAYSLWASTNVRRGETRENGTLTHLAVNSPTHTLIYTARPQVVTEEVLPILAKGRAAQWQLLQFQEIEELFALLQRHYRLAATKVSSDSTLGPQRVTGVEGILGADGAFWGVDLRSGDRIRAIAVTDATTGRLVALQLYLWRGHTWHMVLETQTLEWDVKFPPGIESFTPPPGTRFDRRNYAVDDPVAKGENSDWYVAIHDAHISPIGDLVVALSREPLNGVPVDESRNVRIELVGAISTHYHQASFVSGVYLRAETYTLKRRSEGATPPRTIDLVIDPWVGSGQRIMIRGVPVRLE